MFRLNKQADSLLHNKVYMRVYTAFATAAFGDWFDTLAIQVLVGYRWQAGPLMLGLIPVAVAVPGILLGALAGSAADRFNKLKLMRICDLLTALMTVLILFAPSMYWLLPLLAVRSALSTLNVPAQQSLTRSIVREDQLMQASSLNGIVNQGSKIAGPLLGGLALSVLSPQWCILLNSILRLGSFVLLLRVKYTPSAAESPAEEEQRLPLRKMWTEGWLFIFRSRLLLNTLLFGLVGSLATQMIDFQFTSLFRWLAPQQEGLLGWMVAASGITAVVTILLMNKLNRDKGYGLLLGGGELLLGLAIAGLGLLQPGTAVYPVLLLGAVLGVGNGVLMITFNYCLQKETPPHMIGRVFGIQNTVLSAIMIIAPLLGGLLVQVSGPSAIFMLVGTAVAVLGVGAMLLSPLLWPAAAKRTVPAEVPAGE
ncbi:MFS transporter ['Paenibacillus yunnanensis' Narsing Rao et al. 2020]|uniref:MFS transporter n=1 Tax=Paenibacillus tengchongensis TaxID=2608684 RepID=UPI00124CA580|nr:MFS transporter [Paenibacillus tengchongensis]